MVDLPVLLDGTDHMCCGETRHVGETVRISLAFSRAGQVEITSRPDEINVLDEGKISIVGTADGMTGSDGPFGHGTLIASGDVQFAIHGDAPGPRVQCVGELYEARHGEPSGTTTGQLVAIHWRPGEALRYEPGIELQATDDWLEHEPEGLNFWAFEFTVRVHSDW
jgi:hypothetical protein